MLSFANRPSLQGVGSNCWLLQRQQSFVHQLMWCPTNQNNRTVWPGQDFRLGFGSQAIFAGGFCDDENDDSSRIATMATDVGMALWSGEPSAGCKHQPLQKRLLRSTTAEE